MNKQQLIDKIAADGAIAKGQAELVLNLAVASIQKTVKKGEDVKIVGFGTFSRAKRKARMGRNPKTGSPLKIPAQWVPKFRAGTEFKGAVR